MTTFWSHYAKTNLEENVVSRTRTRLFLTRPKTGNSTILRASALFKKTRFLVSRHAHNRIQSLIAMLFHKQREEKHLNEIWKIKFADIVSNYNIRVYLANEILHNCIQSLKINSSNKIQAKPSKYTDLHSNALRKKSK